MNFSKSFRPCECGHLRKHHTVSRKAVLGDKCHGNLDKREYTISADRSHYIDQTYCQTLCTKYRPSNLMLLELAYQKSVEQKTA